MTIGTAGLPFLRGEEGKGATRYAHEEEARKGKKGDDY